MRLTIFVFFTMILASCQTGNAVRHNPALLEIRPASFEEQPGWEAFDDAISGRSVYADPQPLLTNRDIKRAVRARDHSEHLAIRLTLTEDAGDRLLAYTRRHISEPLAITLDGELIAAPTVMSGLRNDVLISGGPNGLTEEQAASITGSKHRGD